MFLDRHCAMSCSLGQLIEYCLHEEFTKSSVELHVFFICQIHSIALIWLLSGPLNFNTSLKKNALQNRQTSCHLP